MRRGVLAWRWALGLAAAWSPGLGVACTSLKPGDAKPSFDAQLAAEAGGPADDRAETSPDVTVEETGTDAGPDSPADRAGGDVDDAGGDADAASDASGASGTEAGADAGPPLGVAPGHLRLWLRADRGITCTSGRVIRWADQSGRQDDATLQLTQLGPQCRLAQAPHTLNGVDVPYFSAPSNGNVTDESLDVDLSFLAHSAYTLFAVERRWADGNAYETSSLLGTNAPNEANVGPSSPCSARAPDSSLQFGYVYYNGAPELAINQECDDLLVTMTAVPTAGPAAWGQDTAMLDLGFGHVLWRNGTSLIDDVHVNPLNAAVGGAIGRAVVKTTMSGLDGRFRGDIAEVIVYDTALDSGERSLVEQYLQDHWRY